MKIIYRARDIIEANIVSGMLNAEGIETHVGGFYLQGAIGDLAAADFANVQVAEKDVEAAQPFIEKYNDRCSSESVTSEQFDTEPVTI
jgi:hypothetical protein